MEKYGLVSPFIQARMALLLVFIYSPVAIYAAPGDAVSISGQLLQSHPLLSAPAAPKKQNADKISLPAAEELRDEKRGPALLVVQILVKDVPAAAADEVNALVERYRNRKITFNALRNVATAITAIVQKQGDKLSYAAIPEQKITDGLIKINILRGQIDSINVDKNLSLVDDKIINRYVLQMFAFKEQLNRLEGSMSRVTDLPGVGKISSVLYPGRTPGSRSLSLKIAPAPRVEGLVSFDNMGLRASGRDRLGLQLNVNSPLGIGDRLQLLAWGAPGFLQTDGDGRHSHTLIGRLAYDAPVGVSGWRLGAAISRVNYKAGSGSGFADIASLYSSWALLRGERRNFTLGAALDFKRMRDRLWDSKNERRSPVLALQFDGDSQGSLWNRPNLLRYQISPAVGRLRNRSGWNFGSASGHFFKLSENGSFIQTLYRDLSFKINFSGQQASKNLDGAEQMALGGPAAVRAYSNSAASVDSGWVASPALQWVLPWVEGTSLQLFYDYGRGRTQKFAPSAQKVVLKGYGVGVTWDYHDLFFINGSYAWRQGHDDRLAPQNKATGWITLGIKF